MVDGNRAVWGDNYTGSLGNGNNFTQLFPLQVASTGDWLTLTAGDSHALGIRGDGVDVATNTLWAWGANNEGQLGIGNNTDQYVVQLVPAGAGRYWVDVAAGDAHTLAIKDDGTLWSWGWNLWGQLGTGDTSDRNVPVQVGVASNWSMVAAGNGFSLALNTSGELYAWGSNSYGQLGLGDTLDRYYPVQLGTDVDAFSWKLVDGGGGFTLAIRADDSLWAWGYDGFGQLGSTAVDDYAASPVLVNDSVAWIDISAGGDHSLAVNGSGELWAWGRNSAGQLGDGSTTTSFLPIRIGGDSDWVEVAAGSLHSLAFKTDDSLYSWGSNGYGQLGRDSTDNWSSPQPVDLSSIPVVDGSQIYDPLAVDSDGDGVPDVYDTFPTDPVLVANGDLDQNVLLKAADYQLAVRILLGKEAPSAAEWAGYLRFGDVAPLDVNNFPAPDGAFTLGDALVILRRVEQLTSW